ncbi:MAG: PP2C family serine/threonine-protein phosphatase [Candidatus Competibacteraceae bacterium]
MWHYLKSSPTEPDTRKQDDPTHWLWGGASHRGGRDEQQDRWGVFVPPERQGLLAVVADGLGGHGDGALGAQAVIDATEHFLHQQTTLLCHCPAEALSLLCEYAQNRITQVSKLAHSTIIVLWLSGGQAHWMHVGDSRLYQLRRGVRLLRTRDHSAAQLLLDMGEIDEAELATHPEQSRLYRSLGGAEFPRPELGSSGVEVTDLFVLCSDGVWEHIQESEFWEAAMRFQDLTRAATLLVELAATRGGSQADNATLVLIRSGKQRGAGWHWLRCLFGGK